MPDAPDSTKAATGIPQSLSRNRLPLFLAAVFSASVIFYWRGVGPGDAEQYFRTALDWVEKGPVLGDNHWALRHLFILPMVASFLVLGVNEFAATLPNLIFAGALAAATYYFARRYLGEMEAGFSAGFISASAFFVARPLEIEVYGPEVLFVAIAGWLFIASNFERQRFAYLAGSGIFAGFAWTIREHTLFLMAAFGLLILLSRKDVFRSILALGLGFGVVILSEWIIYAIASGDPFYRYRVDLGHRTVSTGKIETVAQAGALRTAIRPYMDLLTSPVTTPFLLVSGAGALYFRRLFAAASAPVARAFLVFAALSAAAFLFSAYGFGLTMPRYYAVLTYFVFLLLGWIAAVIWREWGRLKSAIFVALVVILNAAAADFSRYNEYDEARYLARIALNSSESISTDAATGVRARYQLVFLGMDRETAFKRIVSNAAPEEGVLFFKGYPTRRIADNWCVLLTAEPRRPNVTHAIIRASGAEKIVGAKIGSVTAKPAPVVLARVLSQPADKDPVSGKTCLKVFAK